MYYNLSIHVEGGAVGVTRERMYQAHKYIHLIVLVEHIRGLGNKPIHVKDQKKKLRAYTSVSHRQLNVSHSPI